MRKATAAQIARIRRRLDFAGRKVSAASRSGDFAAYKHWSDVYSAKRRALTALNAYHAG